MNGLRTDEIKINPNRYTYDVNHNFFGEWSSTMAYVLGFTFADGSISKNNCTLAFEQQARDIDILKKIQEVMQSTHPIKLTKNGLYLRLRINSPQIINNLKQHGITTFKARGCTCPIIPKQFLSHFARGFLDGDGWIVIRDKKNKHDIGIGLCHGYKEFLSDLVKQIQAILNLTTSNLRTNIKTTPAGTISCVHSIEWYSHNAIQFINFLYNNLDKKDLYLTRKYEKQLKAREFYKEVILKTKLQRQIEKKHNKPLDIILKELFDNKLNGIQIATKLGVSSAQIYRWLERAVIRSHIKRERKIIFTKCSNCDKQIEQKRKPFIKYCSSSCRNQKKLTGKLVNCAICNKKIYRPQWWFKINRFSLCSKACAKEWQSMRVNKKLIHRSDLNGRFLSSGGVLNV